MPLLFYGVGKYKNIFLTTLACQITKPGQAENRLRVIAKRFSCETYRGFQSQYVAHLAEARHLALGDRRYQGRVPELFAAVDIGQVHLYRRHIDGAYGVAYGDARVRVGGRIYEYRVEFSFCLPNELHDLAFVVRLDDLQPSLLFLRGLLQAAIYLIYRHLAVYVDFSLP